MNYNPSAKRILVFGDSLSWGAGFKGQRYPSNVRWPGKLQMLLGDDYEIIEENLNSRCIESSDPRPGKEGRRGLDYIEPCLDSHDPIDLVVVLLGTNETKYAYNNSAEDIGKSMELLLQTILNRPSQVGHPTPDILLLCPPPVNEQTEFCRNENKYKGATKKSEKLKFVYESLANKLNVKYIALGDYVTVGQDGVHLDETEHTIVADTVKDKITDIWN